MSLKLIREAAQFFVNHAVSKRIKPNISIILEFSPEIMRYNALIEKFEKYTGECEPVYNNGLRPREFIIRVDSSQSVRYILQTIAHEVVHVGQYSSGRLKDYVRTKTNKIKWDDWVYDFGEHDDCDSDLDYYMSPWEIEAYGMQVGLCKLYIKYRKS